MSLPGASSASADEGSAFSFLSWKGRRKNNSTLLKGTSKHGMSLWCNLCTLYLLACQVRVTVDRSLKKKEKKKDVPLVEFMYPVFTRMSCESYRRLLRSLLCLCDDLRALINSLVR